MSKLLLIILTAFILGCGSSSDKDVTVDETDDSDTDQVLFSPVFNIISTRCVDCHSKPTRNGAPMSLVSYDDIFESSELINIRINLEESDPLSMPLDRAPLPQSEKDTINEWIEAGRPNN